MKEKILVIDDDANIREISRLYLEKEGCEVLEAEDGARGLETLQNERVDLVVLDIMMPGMDGYATCREIRKRVKTPVIMLTARGEIFDKVLGLELGADDYIVKPFDPRELTARVKAVIRRTRENMAKPARRLNYDNLVIDMDSFSVTYCKKQLELPPKEMELLYFLASNVNRVFTRDQLLEQVWGFDFFGDSRTVDVHIKRLRARFSEEENWSIKTVWGVGYKFEVK